MRYLLDTNIFIYMATDADFLSKDTNAIIQDYENLLYISAESVKELVVGYRNNSFSHKRWKNCEDMIRSIHRDFNIEILPVTERHLLTYSRLAINEKEGHKDPSDHIIISHAITDRLPLISSDRRFAFYTKQKLNLAFNHK